MKFRDLTAEDIECRIQSVKDTGLILLLYKNARVDMNILDETVGPEKWQREHYECKGNLFCRVGIKFDSEWVWKADCGTESNQDAQKGEASDSFKRACFNWGIGRELYTAPFIWVDDYKCKIVNKKCYDDFTVKYIEIKDKKITDLTIINGKGEVVYLMNKKSPCKPDRAPTIDNKEPTLEEIESAKNVEAKLNGEIIKFNDLSSDQLRALLTNKNETWRNAAKIILKSRGE